MKDAERARIEWDREVARESSRARVAKGALAATFALHAVLLVSPAITSNEVVWSWLTLADLAMLVVTAVVFLRWLACAVGLASSMSAVRLRWRPSGAVWAFFMPIIGLWRPYQVVRDLHAALAPDGVPEPAPKPVLDGSGGYRDVPMKLPPPPRPIPNAWIGAWWGFFIATRLITYNDARVQANVNVVGQVLALVSATCGILVIRGIDARVQERLRRLRHASDDELGSWNIRV